MHFNALLSHFSIHTTALFSLEASVQSREDNWATNNGRGLIRQISAQATYLALNGLATDSKGHEQDAVRLSLHYLQRYYRPTSIMKFLNLRLSFVDSSRICTLSSITWRAGACSPIKAGYQSLRALLMSSLNRQLSFITFCLEKRQQPAAKPHIVRMCV